MIFFPLLILLCYCVLLLALIIGWKKIPEVELHLSDFKPEEKFSIIVPYRNEAENLPALLNSFSKLDYPKSFFEIILVNDASKDRSENICREFKIDHPELKIKLLDNVSTTRSPKKEAITLGIQQAEFANILTTDADCLVGQNWLRCFNRKIRETGARLVAGPVDYIPMEKKEYFHAFQEMDLLSLQAAGAGGFGINLPFMCNGANLCYKKAAFDEANGFSGNENISSGDDVFLLQKFSELKLKVTFLKSREAIVYTKPQTNPAALLSQRIRWAAKTPAYSSFFAKSLGFAVLLMNFCILLYALLALFQVVEYEVFLLSFFLKFIFDLGLLYQSAHFFRRINLLRHFFWSSCLYPFFSFYVAVLSLFKGFEWKGRRFKS